MPCRTWKGEVNIYVSKWMEQTYHTHPLPCRKKRRDTNEEAQESQCTPATVGSAQRDDNGVDDATNDATNTKTTSKHLSGRIAIADGPANEVGVSLVTQSPFDSCNDLAESRGMSRNRKSFQEVCPLSGSEIQHAVASVSDIDGNDSGDLFTERLNGEWLQGFGLLECLCRFPGVICCSTVQSRSVLAPANGRRCHALSIVSARGTRRSIEGIVAILLNRPRGLEISAPDHNVGINRSLRRFLRLDSLLLGLGLFSSPLGSKLLLVLGHGEEAIDVILIPQEELQVLGIVLDVLEKVHELPGGHWLKNHQYKAY